LAVSGADQRSVAFMDGFSRATAARHETGFADIHHASFAAAPI
jgi:hypothetical protein